MRFTQEQLTRADSRKFDANHSSVAGGIFGTDSPVNSSRQSTGRASTFSLDALDAAEARDVAPPEANPPTRVVLPPGVGSSVCLGGDPAPEPAHARAI